MRKLGVLSALAVLACVTQAAEAVERKGFLFGVGVGAGGARCKGCEALSGPAVELHLGGMLNDRVALVVDGSGVARSGNDTTPYSTVAVGALQYWAAERVWIKGGAGLGQLRLGSESASPDDARSGLAFGAGVGLEILRWDYIELLRFYRPFVMDLQLRCSTARIDGRRVNNLSAVVGFNVY